VSKTPLTAKVSILSNLKISIAEVITDEKYLGVRTNELEITCVNPHSDSSYCSTCLLSNK
jgi:hypothetical protein